jgi:hypothetical protein
MIRAAYPRPEYTESKPLRNCQGFLVLLDGRPRHQPSRAGEAGVDSCRFCGHHLSTAPSFSSTLLAGPCSSHFLPVEHHHHPCDTHTHTHTHTHSLTHSHILCVCVYMILCACVCVYTEVSGYAASYACVCVYVTVSVCVCVTPRLWEKAAASCRLPSRHVD